MKSKLKAIQILTWIIALVTFCTPIKAQEGYFTTYGSTIEKGELEFSLMIDHTSPSMAKKNQGQHNYLSQMPELEYHPTEQIALEFMTESFQEFETGITKFTGFRFETRYRLFKKKCYSTPQFILNMKIWTLNPALKWKLVVGFSHHTMKSQYSVPAKEF